LLFDRVLVANRGEIAVRVIGTLRRLGIESVAVYTDVDRRARHVGLADRALGLGAAGSYLDPDRLVEAAVESGASALHPGYGFLSENPALARACSAAGVVFVGPPADAIEMMGDKIRAKQTVAAVGVPVVPGSSDPALTDGELSKAAIDIGFPVLLKPSAGGGGKGMRLVEDPSDFEPEVAAARREAIAAFGDGTLMVERYVARPRHIEVQVFGDAHGRLVALGERECSLQRRHQKIIEEAPSPLLNDATRAAMCASAVDAARACGYRNAGTVEFIVPGDRPDEYFFMEMNTRLQVEHPVTEMVLDVDLVEWQLRVAAGQALPWTEPPLPHGHAVEARIYAEDTDRGFLPASGRVIGLQEPEGQTAVRVDSALYRGLTVGTDYDPMLAKVVAWGPDRRNALRTLSRALANTAVLGVVTNVGFLRRLVELPEVEAGELDTGLVEREAPRLKIGAPPQHLVAAAALLDHGLSRPSGPVVDPWLIGDGWRISGRQPVRSTWLAGGAEIEVRLGADGMVTVGDSDPSSARADLDGDRLSVEAGGVRRDYLWARVGDRFWLSTAGDTWELTAVRETIEHAGPAAAGSGEVTSPMPGRVIGVHVTAGQPVEEGQPLLSVEAMKMEHVLRASVAGTVRELLVGPGDPVNVDQLVALVDQEESG
jgi:acetyl-CoA/propionyl-CoA carboxylase biotin carboxyl carrier protein